jgi:hypothetical protein
MLIKFLWVKKFSVVVLKIMNTSNTAINNPISCKLLTLILDFKIFIFESIYKKRGIIQHPLNIIFSNVQITI